MNLKEIYKFCLSGTFIRHPKSDIIYLIIYNRENCNYSLIDIADDVEDDFDYNDDYEFEVLDMESYFAVEKDFGGYFGYQEYVKKNFLVEDSFKIDAENQLSTYNKYLKFKDASNKQKSNNVNKENTMTKTTSVATTIKDANVSSAKLAAKITLGKTANKLLAKKIKPKLPFTVKGYAEHPLFNVVVANVINVIVKHKMPDNQKLNLVSDAMLDASMLEFADSFNIDEMISSFLDDVKIPSVLTKSSTEEE